MKHAIDPKVDCVFKAVLGAAENRNLLIHFLNAVLATELATPLVDVTLLNPYNERETLDDKLSIVDVKARDREGQLFQIEVQLSIYGNLLARMLYTWCDIYSQQLASGQGYAELRPTYSIWLLADRLLSEPDYIRDYKPRDRQGRSLVDHGGIWICELAKLPERSIANETERWLRFFKDGEHLDDEALPAWMQTEEMQQAMGTVRQFSEKERKYHAYQARLNYLREQQSIQAELAQAKQMAEQVQREKERERQEKEQERQEKEQARRSEEQARLSEEQARQDKEAALAEIERLKAALAKQQGDS